MCWWGWWVKIPCRNSLQSMDLGKVTRKLETTVLRPFWRQLDGGNWKGATVKGMTIGNRSVKPLVEDKRVTCSSIHTHTHSHTEYSYFPVDFSINWKGGEGVNVNIVITKAYFLRQQASLFRVFLVSGTVLKYLDVICGPLFVFFPHMVNPMSESNFTSQFAV